MRHIDILLQTLSMIDKKSEGFSLPPFENLTQMVIPPDFEQYKFDKREFYDVIDDFDIPPDKLTNNQKVLRKKYLNMILSIMEYKDEIKTELQKSLKSDDKYTLQNFEASFNTVKRIINLLIMEIDPPSCPSCPVCPEDEKGYKIATIILGIILLIISIMIGTMFISRFMS